MPRQTLWRRCTLAEQGLPKECLLDQKMLIARFLKRWREFFLKILSPQKLFFKSKTRGVAFLKEIFYFYKEYRLPTPPSHSRGQYCSFFSEKSRLRYFVRSFHCLKPRLSHVACLNLQYSLPNTIRFETHKILTFFVCFKHRKIKLIFMFLALSTDPKGDLYK